MEQYGSGNTDGQDHGRFMAQDAFKECEYCGERILVRDTRCKYCGSLLGTLIHNSSGYLQYRPVNTQAYPQNISQSQYGPQAQYQPQAQYGPQAQYQPQAQYGPQAQYQPQAQYRPQAQYQPQPQYIPNSKDSWRQRDQQAWQYPPQYMQDGQIPHQYAPVGCQTPSQYPPSVYQPQ
ncbi:MAG: hypothetical protein HGA22_03495, partial [Clostridiales bacterium]|nr:hypothetical protein [Clostridiales bacterium]